MIIFERIGVRVEGQLTVYGEVPDRERRGAEQGIGVPTDRRDGAMARQEGDMKTMLLRAWSSDNKWSPISGVIIQLDARLARRLLAVRAEYDALRKHEDKLTEISLFDYSAAYLEEVELPEGVADLVFAHTDGDVTELTVPELIAAKLAEEEDWDKYHASMEVCQMHVSEHGVRWSALVKHTDVEITTPHLDYKTIGEVAES